MSEWFSSFEYQPKHGTQIFVWDRELQKQLHLYALWDEDAWRCEQRYPCWCYVLDGNEAITIQAKEEE